MLQIFSQLSMFPWKLTNKTGYVDMDDDTKKSNSIKCFAECNHKGNNGISTRITIK